ncbi:MAG: AMP-binding protein, partial [Actinomycetota bacterium]|nr:AMP-binding protein [Actinomycetota bacterium]
MGRNLASIVTETAEKHADGIAYRLDDVEVPWKLVDDGSARVASLLSSKGSKPGDRVGIMLPNVPYFPIAYYGVLRAGGVVVPMNVLLKGREVKFYLEDSGARLLFAWGDFAEAAGQGAREAGAEVIGVAPGEFEKLLAEHEPDRKTADRGGEDTAVILYTSGTTGQPKGAELTHDNLLSNAQVSRDLFQTGSDDVLLGALPLFHSFGQTCCMNASAIAGATLSFIPRFDPGRALEIIERDKVTLFAGVPTMYNAMLNREGREELDTSSLK